MPKTALEIAMDQGNGDIDAEDGYENLEFTHPENYPLDEDEDQQERNEDDGGSDEAGEESQEDSTGDDQNSESESPSELSELRAQVSELLDFIKNQGNGQDNQQQKRNREPLQLLTPQDDLMEIFGSVEGVNGFANRLADALEKYQNEVIAEKVQEAMNLYNYSQEFYRVNADLVAHKDKVAEISQDIINRNPKITSEKLFEMTAVAARKELGLKNPPRQERNTKPGFVPVRNGSKKPAAGMSRRSEQDDVAAMLLAARR